MAPRLRSGAESRGFYVSRTVFNYAIKTCQIKLAKKKEIWVACLGKFARLGSAGFVDLGSGYGCLTELTEIPG